MCAKMLRLHFAKGDNFFWQKVAPLTYGIFQKKKKKKKSGSHFIKSIHLHKEANISMLELFPLEVHIFPE